MKTRPTLTLTAAHLAGNALLLWLGYYWLGLGESRTITLLWSFLVALAGASLACLLHGAAFVYFEVYDLRSAWRTAFRHLLSLLAAALAVVLVYSLVSRWAENSGEPAFKIASWLTLKLRKPVKPATILRIFSVVTWLFRWVILPVLLVPVMAGTASMGWRGFSRFGRLAGKRLYWFQVPILLLAAFWVPFKLMGWVPETGAFAMEIVSFTVRLLLAYLLFVGSCLLLEFFTSAGKPVLTQAKTAVSP